MLLDQFGRPIKKMEKQPERREIAVTAVRDRWSSYPSSGLTPGKLATIFKEADGGSVYRQAELFEEMEEKDTHLFSEFQTRKNAVLGLDYDIEPYDSSNEAKKIAEFCADVLFNLPSFEESQLDSLDSIPKGYSIQELIWDVVGGKAVIAGFKWIHAKKAVFTDFEKNMWEPAVRIPRIITEAEPINGEDLPPFKLVYHRYKARSGYDTRAGILRTCAWMYLFKNYGIKDWVAFAEVFGMPLRVGKYDAGASKDDKDALKLAIQSLGTDAAGIISKNTEIEFIESVKNASKDNIFETLAKFCNGEMSKAILGQTATTEGTPGKLGADDAQSAVRQDLIESDAGSLANTNRFQVLRPLVGYNFGWDKALPWYRIKYEAPEDLEYYSEVYDRLHKMNFPLSAKHVSERFGVPLPDPKDKDDFVLPAGTGPAPFAMRRVAAKNRRFSPEQEALEQEALEQLNLRTGKEAPGAVSAILGPARELILSAGSLEEIRDKIYEAYSDMDPRALEDLVARAIYTADLYGRSTIEEKTGDMT